MGGADGVSVRVTQVTAVARVTGEDSPNRTGSRFGVYGTDLGILWDNGRGETLVAFGDSYGAGWGGDGAGPAEADWRCNVLARSGTRELDRGLALSSFVARADGAAAQVLARSSARREETVIPTSGIAVGGRNYLHYMSVREWGPPGRWRTNHAGIAVSDDGGDTWRQPAQARWPNRRGPFGRGLFGGGSFGRGLFGRGSFGRGLFGGGLFRLGGHPFQLGAFARGDGVVYLFGTPAGRFGSASLARVADARVLEPAAYEYWTGAGWAADPFAAAPLFGPVGELSVAYHGFLGRWVALHLDEARAALVLRSAPEPTGPWDAGTVVVSAERWPAPYGGYLHPWALDGPEVYFTLSQWGPYNVTLMRATLAR